MKKIEESLINWFEKINKKQEFKLIFDKNEMVLKESFLAGYNQAIEDRKKIEGVIQFN